MHDPTGERYGMLEVLGYSGRKYKNGDRYVFTRCDCGVEKEMTYPATKAKNRSCGCQRWQGTHQMSSTPIYASWKAMHSRCYCETNKAFEEYGGRGIKVCRRWHNFDRFYEDMSATFKEGLVLDRINNGKGYLRSNCRWLTRAESNRNMRCNISILVEGRTLCFAEVVREYGQVKYRLALWRFRQGWGIPRAIEAVDTTIIFKEIR